MTKPPTFVETPRDSDASMVRLDDVEAAEERIGGDVHVTPTWSARSLGAELGVEVWVKAELLQRTGSFKVRGVLNALALMTPSVRSRGVASMSAGNHAAALAFGAAVHGTTAVIVMPTTASATKISATRAYGGEVVLTERPLPEVLHEIHTERQLRVVHPFDDLDVIAGAGTVGLELTDQLNSADVVLVPVGGGGLLSGVAAAVRPAWPRARIVGVEPVGADAMSQALSAGVPVPLPRPMSIADGLTAPYAGKHTLTHVRHLVDSIVRVSDAQIEIAVRRVVERTKLAVEPAAAAGLAALQAGLVSVEPGSRVALILSGGNVDPVVLGRIMTSGPSPPVGD